MQSAAQLQPDPRIIRQAVHARVAAPVSDTITLATPALDRTAATVVAKAADVGVSIDYLGVEALHRTCELYPGNPAWVVCPSRRDPLVQAGLPIPAKHRAALATLVDAGLNFPHLFFAHEVPSGLALPAGADNGDKITLSDEQVKALVVRPESPAATRRTAERIEKTTRVLARSAAQAAKGLAIAGAAVAAAPALLLADGLDPAVLGAVTRPEDRHLPDPPAAYFLLARWDW